jgi:hypothetical protein
VLSCKNNPLKLFAAAMMDKDLFVAIIHSFLSKIRGIYGLES